MKERHLFEVESYFVQISQLNLVKGKCQIYIWDSITHLTWDKRKDTLINSISNGYILLLASCSCKMYNLYEMKILNACYWYYCDLFIHAYVYFSFYTVTLNQNVITWSSAMPYFSYHFVRLNPHLTFKAHIQFCLHSINNQWTDQVSALHFCYITSQYRRSLYLCDMDLYLSPVRFFSYFLEAKCLEKYKYIGLYKNKEIKIKKLRVKSKGIRH